jgi:hypothetical protein
LPELEVGGLPEDEARVLLDSALTAPLDARVRDLIIAESQGNPLALLELPRGLGPAELAGGFGLPSALPLASRIEDSFARQLDAIPADTRQLLQLAAADQSGGPGAGPACGPAPGYPGPGRGGGDGSGAGDVRRPGQVQASAGPFRGLPVDAIHRQAAVARSAG